jgi:perosamine synthetase
MNSPVASQDAHFGKGGSAPQVRLITVHSGAPLGLVELEKVSQNGTHIEKSAQRMNDGSITFWRGRVALYAILKALGIECGHAVVLPGYTCFAMPSAVCFTGAQPLYADIQPSTFNLTLETVQSAIRDNPGANVKAIIIQHTYGIPAETQPIVSWARERGIATIEDCAHVLGSRYRDDQGHWIPAGSLADASFYSSQWTKPISTGLGGWANTHDLNLRAALNRFRSEHCVQPSRSEVAILASQVAIRTFVSHPRIDGVLKQVYQALYGAGLLVGTSSREELLAQMPAGYAKRMSPFQEHMLQRSTGHGAIEEQHRRQLKKVYDEAFQSAGLSALNVSARLDAVLLRYPIRIKQKARALTEAKRYGFEIGDWYNYPIDGPSSLDRAKLGYRPATCPEAERACREVVNLPMGCRVTASSVVRMVRFLMKFA